MQKPISAGTVISHRYQIQKKIQDNTFNSCYLAEDSENSNRLVTLSLPRIELLLLPDFVPTFDKVCAKLMTPPSSGLLKVLGNGEYKSHPYAVIQYVADERLEHVLGRKLLSSSKMDMDSVLDWATPLAVSLDELHFAGYVHGNLKPSSVYMGSQKVLMGDFITECTLQMMGKFKNGITTLNVDQYLSPEYLKSSYTPSYDQYLLATMVYEALAGKVPFARAKGGDDYRMQVATHVSPLLTAHRPELKAVSDVLAKAMKRKPSDRFKSCRDFISKLQEAQAVEPAKPPPQKRVVITTPFSDEPEEEEEVATSASSGGRSEKRSGGKKGLFWLSVLFLTGGAAAFTAVNYPDVFGFDTPSGQKSETSNDVKTVLAPEIPVTNKVVEPEVVETKVEVKDVEVAATVEPVQAVIKDEATEVLVVLGKNEAGEGELLNEATSAELNSVINQALESGYENFKATKAVEAKEIAQSVALDEAVTQALLNGHDAFVSQAATEKFEDLQAAVVNDIAETEVQVETEDASVTPNSALSAVENGVEVVNTAEGEASVSTNDSASVNLAAGSTPLVEQAQVELEETANSVTSEEVLPVVVEPEVVVKTPRERLQEIKQQKIARIKSITDDCTIGGKVHREVATGNLPYVKNCMSVGVQANLKQNNGWSLLHIAARGGHLNICKLLVAKGAVVNAKAKNGQTPLAMAIALRQDRVASYLKTRGAVTK